MASSNKIAVIDLDSILFAGAWGHKIYDPETGDYLRDEKGRLIYKDKTEEEIGESIDNILNSILVATEATHYIAYVKGKKTGSHRYQAKPDYKSNRPKESPTWWEFAKNYVIVEWGAVSVDFIEVDDAVSITKNKLSDSFIVAIDKDLLHLEGTHYNWRREDWVENDAAQASEYFWKDMVTGQTGDGVQGLPKYGEKAAIKLLSLEGAFQVNVFNEYLKVYGEHKGIQEFYKNYTCLKILDDYEGFEIPKPIEYITKPVDEDIFNGI